MTVRNAPRTMQRMGGVEVTRPEIAVGAGCMGGNAPLL
jgi:hypothetical protein